MAEAAAAHLRERHAARRDERPDRERRLVAHAAGRVLVDDLAARARRRGRASRRCATIASVSANVSRAREPAEVHGHAERRHLVVGHVAARVAEDELGELVGPSSLAVALALDQLGRPDHRSLTADDRLAAGGPASAPGRRARRSPSRRRRRTRRPRARARRRSGPATYASSSACSREWSVDGVVGSQPWSEVRIKQVARRAARRAGRAAGGRSPAGSGGSSPGRCGGPRACPSRRGSRRRARRRSRAAARSVALDPVDVRLRRERLVDVAAGEDVGDLADAVDRLPGVADEREVVRPPRLEREVVAVRRALVVARLADERPRDHAADGVLAGQDLARDPAGLVELLERDRLLVRRDLEDRVGGRVDDPLAGALVLLAELLDDLRARRRLVAEHAAAGAVHERVDHVVREAVRVRRHRRAA